MGIEIERKYIASSAPDAAWRGHPAVRVAQGYLSTEVERTVRIRVIGDEAFITVKGPSVGATRAEFEYPIPVADADEMLRMCKPSVVEKLRRRIQVDGKVWDVDEFLGANLGLNVAEIELASEDEPFTKPDWVGAEVTDDKRYFNSCLIAVPFTVWADAHA